MKLNLGRFRKGEHRTCLKVCQRCGKKFLANSGHSKFCPECKKEMLICPVCGGQKKDIYHQFCSNSCAGKWKYENSIKVREALKKGTIEADEITKKKRAKAISMAQKGKPRYNMRGENNPNWKGGTYGTERHKDMGRIEYLTWRKKVFERDGYRCVVCGKVGGQINAHHIRSWKDFPEERYDVDNGITLCVNCHRLIHKEPSIFAIKKEEVGR